MNRQLRVVSYGGGVQSTALLVLAAQARIDFGVFLFANVGDDSEDPATLDYLRRHAMPCAARHGIGLHELHRRRRDGTVETLYGEAAEAEAAALVGWLRSARIPRRRRPRGWPAGVFGESAYGQVAAQGGSFSPPSWSTAGYLSTSAPCSATSTYRPPTARGCVRRRRHPPRPGQPRTPTPAPAARGVPASHRRGGNRVRAARRQAEGRTRQLRAPLRHPCQHERACIRCPTLRINPKVLPRLDELEQDLLAAGSAPKPRSYSAGSKASTSPSPCLDAKSEEAQRLSRPALIQLGTPKARGRPRLVHSALLMSCSAPECPQYRPDSVTAHPLRRKANRRFVQLIGFATGSLVNKPNHPPRLRVDSRTAAEPHGRKRACQQEDSVVECSLGGQLERDPPRTLATSMGPSDYAQAVSRPRRLVRDPRSPRPYLGDLNNGNVQVFVDVDHVAVACMAMQPHLCSLRVLNHVRGGDPSATTDVERGSVLNWRRRINVVCKNQGSRRLHLFHSKRHDQIVSENANATEDRGNRCRDRDPAGRVNHSRHGRDGARDQHDQRSPAVPGLSDRWPESAHVHHSGLAPTSTQSLCPFDAMLAAGNVIQLGEVQRSTVDFKITVVGRWLKAHGASATNPATVGIGISLDEIWRVNRRRAEPYGRPVYPLLEHDPPLRRADCQAIIAAAGLPVPPKSACYFCPLKRPSAYGVMRRDRPELFDRVVALEALLNQRRQRLGRDPVWLTRFNRPLPEAVARVQDPLPGLDSDPHPDEGCDNGVCFT